ncbi:MAG: cell division protein ZipA [Gammaproteobacteria bacterium]
MKYILLFVFFGLIALAILRALIHEGRQPKKKTQPQEPSLGLTEPLVAMAQDPVIETLPEIIQEQLEEMVAEETAAPTLPRPELIVIYLLAESERPYRGYELLQALLTTGLRFSKRGVFYRFEDITGRGNVLFSLISGVEPGTFDLPKMGSFSTPALTLFMQVATVENPARALEILVQTAKDLVEYLGGTICDETRQALTEEKIEQWREILQVEPVDV